MDVKKLLCRNLREKPETMRASRRLGNIDFSKLIHMGLNENVFGMSPKAAEAMRSVAESGNYYADWLQTDLKNAIADHFGLAYENVVTGCGSSALTDALGLAFLEEGDELLLCMPTFPAIIDTAQMNGAKPVVIPTTSDYKYDLDGLLAAMNEKTKMVYICNPNNPTGTYVGIDALMDFARKCPDNVIQVYDEAYIEFADAPDCVEMVEAMKELKDKPIILLKTFSKFYAMAGIRVGYILAQPEIIAELSKCGTQFGVSKVSQAGAVEAIKDKEFGEYVKKEVAKGRKYLTDELKALGCTVYESQTNFIFFDTHADAQEVNIRMMEKGIMMSAQAGANRVSVSTMEDCRLYIRYLTEILGELRK